MPGGKRVQGPGSMPPSIGDKKFYFDANDEAAVEKWRQEALKDPRLAREAAQNRTRLGALEGAEARIVAAGFRDPNHYKNFPYYCHCAAAGGFPGIPWKVLRGAPLPPLSRD